MLDKKQRFYRLIESYINDYQKDAVELMYGEGAKIKIHSWSYNGKGDTFLFELVIVLGEIINESVMDKTMAEVLLRDSLVYFYPEIQKIKCMVRFDV